MSPETGLPLLRQVYYCRESVHCSPKRMFMSCHLVWRLNVDQALEQLKLQRKKVFSSKFIIQFLIFFFFAVKIKNIWCFQYSGARRENASYNLLILVVDWNIFLRGIQKSCHGIHTSGFSNNVAIFLSGLYDFTSSSN